MNNSKEEKRKKRHRRIRKKITGTAKKPRMVVFRSNRYIYVQLVDDSQGLTLASASSLDKNLPENKRGRLNAEVASLVGGLIAQKAAGKNIQEVAFDRGGYIYHGKISALAEGARKQGLKF